MLFSQDYTAQCAQVLQTAIERASHPLEVNDVSRELEGLRQSLAAYDPKRLRQLEEGVQALCASVNAQACTEALKSTSVLRYVEQQCPGAPLGTYQNMVERAMARVQACQCEACAPVQVRASSLLFNDMLDRQPWAKHKSWSKVKRFVTLWPSPKGTWM